MLRTPQFSGITRGSTGETTLNFQCTPGKTYRLQYRNDLDTGDWIDLSADTVAQQIELNFNDHTPARPQRFYRLLILR